MSELQSFQVKDFMKSYNKLADSCFANCINTFSTRNLPPEESICINNCFSKSLKVYTRIGLRLQEYQDTHIS